MSKRFIPFKQFPAGVIPDAFFPGPPNMSATAKLLWSRLARYAGNKDHCYPSQKLLSQDMGLSMRQLQAVIMNLKELGFIETEPRWGKTGNRIGTNYFFTRNEILFPEPSGNADEEENSESEGETGGRSFPHPPPVGNRGSEENQRKDSFLTSVKKGEATPSLPAVQKLVRRHAVDRSLYNKPAAEQEPKPVKEKRWNNLVITLYDFWVHSGLPADKQKSRSLNKTYEAISALLRGKLFNRTTLERYHDHPFSVDEIKTAIRNFAAIALDSNIKPAPSEYKLYLSRMHMLPFLHNPFHKGDIPSYFVYCLENTPEHVPNAKMFVADRNPEFTKKIISMYQQKYLGGLTTEITPGQHAKFVLAGTKAKAFIQQKRGKLSFSAQLTDTKLAEYVFNSVVKDFNGNMNVAPGVFSSDETFIRRLPQYLVSEGLTVALKQDRWHI